MCGIDFRRTALPPGSVEFFATFARFEFALKATRYLGRDQEGGAFARWDPFANDLGRAFFDRFRDSGHAATLIGRPPKKQIVANHTLGWSTPDPLVSVQELFVAVRRVRNNLCHGGKSGDIEQDPDDPRRNEKLIAESHLVLLEALRAHDEVRWAFEGRE
jgi:hypothetical protein